MADLLLDPITKDLVIVTDLSFTTGITTVAQRLELKFRSFKEEWAFDLDNGFLEIDKDGDLQPSDTTVILGGKYNQANVTAAARKLLIETDGVDEIVSLVVSFEGSTRTGSIDWKIRAGEEFTSGSLDI